MNAPHRRLSLVMGSVLSLAVLVTHAAAQVIPAPGYIYSAQLLGSDTRGCVAVGPGGTFVAIGAPFSPNAQAIVLARESGDTRLVAFGFSSIGDCAYDAARDVLYATDNAADGDTPGALTGDTVFVIPSASTAAGLMASGLELLPSGALPAAASVTVDPNGDVFVGDAAGGTLGSVVKIDVDAGPTATPFASGFGFTGGLAIDPMTGNVLVGDTLSTTFEAQIRVFDSTGSELTPLAGPSFDFGSFDLAFDTTDRVLTTGVFAGDVVAFDTMGTPSPFASGLAFATGVTVNGFTGRVEILSTGASSDEDRSIHRFTPVDRLVPGSGKSATECIHEFYGIALVASAPGKKARKAICVDGAPCDADGTVNDRCLFPLGFCLNVEDPGQPACSPTSDVVEFTATAKPESVAIVAATESAQTVLPLGEPSCVFSDGVAVPVKVKPSGKKPGKAMVRVTAKTADAAKDVDTVVLLCEAAAS